MSEDPIPIVSEEEVEGDRMNDFSPRIYKRRELLRPTYVPNMARIVGRDKEIGKLEDVLQPAAHGEPPGDAAIISKPGTGKTLCAKNVAGRLRTIGRQNDVQIITSYVNCGEAKTETQVAQSLAESVNRQLDASENVPKSGISTGQFLGILWDLLEHVNSFIVVLDEIDKLGNDANDVIKTLADAESDGKACYTGTIVISNKTSFYDNLDPRVQSRFQNNDTEMIFGPYHSNQLQEILRNREDAFNDDVLEEDVIPLCSAFAAQEHGDARKAIDLLRAAGERAEKMNKDTVSEQDVREVHEEAATSREKELVRTSIDHAQYALFALAFLTQNNRPMKYSTGDIYQMYEKVCSHLDNVTPQSHTNVLNHLKKWAEVELTENDYTGAGKGKGSFREHTLLMDATTVMNIIQEETMEDDVLGNLNGTKQSKL